MFYTRGSRIYVAPILQYTPRRAFSSDVPIKADKEPVASLGRRRRRRVTKITQPGVKRRELKSVDPFERSEQIQQRPLPQVFFFNFLFG